MGRGTLREVRDRSRYCLVSSGRSVDTRLSGTGRSTLGKFGTGRGTLGKVRDTTGRSGTSRGTLGMVGDRLGDRPWGSRRVGGKLPEVRDRSGDSRGVRD